MSNLLVYDVHSLHGLVSVVFIAFKVNQSLYLLLVHLLHEHFLEIAFCTNPCP